MTYPVDDNGNIRVDFVWGNFPLQPDENRGDDSEDIIGPNSPENRGWSGSTVYYASPLNTSETQYLSVGDQNDDASWQDPDTRSVSVPTAHDIATTGWSNFPAYIPNYSGDGDTGLEVVVPNLASLSIPDAEAAVEAAGLVWNRINTATGATSDNHTDFKLQSPAAGTAVNPGSTVNGTYFQASTMPNLIGMNTIQIGNALTAAGLVGQMNNTTDGATLANNGTVKSQTVAPGIILTPGTIVPYVLYNYVPVANPIAGINQSSFPGHSVLTGNDVYMFLVGRTTKPAVGNTITVASNSNSTLNGNWTVNVVEDNDSYNSGGTVVTMTKVGGGVTGVPGNTGGTWVLA